VQHNTGRKCLAVGGTLRPAVGSAGDAKKVHGPEISANNREYISSLKANDCT